MLNKALLPVFVILASFLSIASAQEEANSTEITTRSSVKPAAFYFDFIDYRYDLHRRVIARWQDLVNKHRDKLNRGKVKIKYFINSAGAISSIESTQPGNFASEKSNERKLAEYALALDNKEPAPFPESVRREFPDGYFYQITLVVR